MSANSDMEQDSIEQSPPTNPNSSKPNSEPKKATETKRVLACGTCRKRKLKCDSKRPKCSTCARLGHPCQYDEVRKKSGPKRGYVKELEARLKQVETLLTTQQGTEDVSNTSNNTGSTATQQPFDAAVSLPGFDGIDTSIADMNQGGDGLNSDLNMMNDFNNGGGLDSFNWDMISLGLEEPLPSQESMDELYRVYFEKIHPSLPMIHRPRFMASLSMSMSLRPPVCLRYIMWAHACALSPEYKTSAENFYLKSRKYAEQDEMKGHGESFISVYHAQTWSLISTYEFKSMYFPRAWMSSGRASRLCQLMGLHRQDRVGLDVKQTMAPPKDWIEREERRRTFWMAYCNDRYASIGTGWPMAIDERDILTNLPASHEAFITGKAEPTSALSEIMDGEGVSGLSPFAGVCLLATLFGRNLTHLHRPADDDNDHDLNGEFWKRHRSLDNILLNTSLSLPAHLRLPYGLTDPNIIFANMNIHTSTICLHQAAIFKADKHRLPQQISAESKRRCIVAADQITNIMKMCSHLDLSLLNPFIAFCLYVASRVFVQYLKSRKEDQAVRSSLTFLLSAMQALKFKNPLTESFLVQLDVDLEGSGLNMPSPLGPDRYAARAAAECPANMDSVKCLPIFEIRESQTIGQTARDVPSRSADSDMSNIDMSGLGYNVMTHRHYKNHPEAQTETITADGNNGNNFMFAGSMDNINQAQGSYFQNLSPQAMADGQSNGSHSNHATPSMSDSSNHNSSNHSFTPPSVHETSNTPFMSDKQRQFLQRSPQQGFAFTAGGSSTEYKINPTHTTSTINNNVSVHTLQDNVNGGFGSLFGGTGFTPGPTGMTPGPTGLTPGPSGMTPMTGWNDMNMPENNDWMFQGWPNNGQQTG